jgi:hypothetical protein
MLTKYEVKALGSGWRRTRPAIVTVYPHNVRTVALHSGYWSGERSDELGVPKGCKPVIIYDIATGKTRVEYMTKSGNWLEAQAMSPAFREWQRSRAS